MHTLLLLGLVSCILIIFLFVPGYFILSSCHLNDSKALSYAPLVSVAMLEIVSIVCAKLSIALNPLNLSILLFVVPLLIWLIRTKPLTAHTFSGQFSIGRLKELWIWPALFIFGIVIANYIFVKQVGDLEYINQNYDFFFHLNTIRSMASSGNLSSLSVNFYRDASFGAPWNVSGFYPAAYHAYMALLVMFTNLSVPAIITLGTASCAAVIYPIGLYVLAKEILRPDAKNINRFNVGVLIFTLATNAFPWALITFGPLYANIFGNALLPFFLLFVIQTLKNAQRLQDIFSALPLLFFGLVSMAFAHPNTVFSAYIMLLPFVGYMIYKKSPGTVIKRCAYLGIYLILYALVWVGLYFAPPLHDIVQHSWHTYSYPIQAVLILLSQNLSWGFANADPAPLVLIPFALCGLYCSSKSKQTRWLAISYVIVAFIFIYNACYSGRLRQIIAGFWYTDPVRIASMLTLMSTIFCIQGFIKLHETLMWVSRKLPGIQKIRPRSALIISSAILLFFAYLPNVSWPGNNITTKKYTDPMTGLEHTEAYSNYTAIGTLRETISQIYRWQSPLSKDERYFISEIKPIVGNSLVLNNPLDGSFLAYGTDNLNLYYRHINGFNATNESQDSMLLRKYFYQIGENQSVFDCVQRLQIKYVLVLSKQDTGWSFINLRGDYIPDNFYGIYSVTSSTPHLKLVLEDKGCYLYEIV